MHISNHLHVGGGDAGKYALVKVSETCHQHTVGLWGKERGRRGRKGGGGERGRGKGEILK